MKISIMLKNLYSSRWLLMQLVDRDIKTKYKRSLLGRVWSLLNPLLMMMVMTAVFSNIFNSKISNFPAYFLCGNVIFNCFSESTNAAMLSISSGGDLMKKVYVPKYIFPLSKVLSSFVNLGYSLIAVIIILLVTRVPITWTILMMPIPIFYLFFICFGAGLILSVIATFFRDMVYLYSVFILAMMYMTPLFYPIESMSESVQAVIRLNPIYHVVSYFRSVAIWNTVPTLEKNLACIVSGVVLMAVGLFLFRKKQDKFILYI